MWKEEGRGRDVYLVRGGGKKKKEVVMKEEKGIIRMMTGRVREGGRCVGCMRGSEKK